MNKIKFAVDTNVGKISVEIMKHDGFYITKTGNPKGILVTAVVTSPTGVKARGEAMCHPSDKFNYGYGAKMALSRALELGNRKNIENRKKIWKKFFYYFPKNEIDYISWKKFLDQTLSKAFSLSA